MSPRIRQPRPLASEPQRVIDSPYLTTAEAAAYLRFSDARCLYKAIYGGLDVPFVRRGKTMLFHRGDLDRWLNGESRVAMLNDARSKVGA